VYKYTIGVLYKEIETNAREKIPTIASRNSPIFEDRGGQEGNDNTGFHSGFSAQILCRKWPENRKPH